MKDFKKNYKKAFLDSLNEADDLEKIKSRLEFENNSPIKLPSNKRPIIITSLSFVLVAILVLVISMTTIVGNKNIPTYTGMEVINYANQAKMANLLADDDDDDIVEDEVDNDLPSIETKDEISYYAKKGEKITIAIHINNPKQYEILSFVLNGYKYQTFMFKEDSTNELIYVDFTCQNESGIQNIYIEELKYIDGTETKFARYDGNQTIKVAIAYANIPNITINNEKVDDSSYQLDFILNDVDDLINSDNFYRAYLVEEGKISQKLNLKPTTTTILFENLKINTTYKIYIYVGVDLLDGNGYSKLAIYKQSFNTLSAFKATNIVCDYEEISFTAEAEREDIIITGAKLYLANKLVKEISGDNIKFRGLQSNTTYKLEVNYKYLLNNEEINDSISYNVTTNTYTEPKVDGLVLYLRDDKIINLDLELQDPYELVLEYTINVYGDEELIKETKDFLDAITVDKDYNEIKVVVNLKIDYRDGKEVIIKEFIERG